MSTPLNTQAEVAATSPSTVATSRSAEKPQPSERSLEDLINGETVKMFVGPKRKEYTPHKELLMARSEYFRHALGGGFKEGNENTIYFPEDEPEAFDLFVRWLYKDSKQALPVPALGTGKSILHWYLLADKLHIEKMKNDAISMMKKYLNTKLPSIFLILWTYLNTLPGDHMRVLLLKDVVWRYTLGGCKESDFMEYYGILAKKGGDVAVDLMKYIFDAQKGKLSEPRKDVFCVYHVHKDTPKC